MRMAFEEIVSQEIDGLYQGALFLTGGAAEEAESLLSRTVRASFRVHRTAQIDVDPGAWLQGRLVDDFLESGDPVSLASLPSFSVEAHSGAELKRIYRAAASVPPLARAALWLVLFRRWRHSAVLDQLGLERAELRELLKYRHSLMAAVMGEKQHREWMKIAN